MRRVRSVLTWCGVSILFICVSTEVNTTLIHGIFECIVTCSPGSQLFTRIIALPHTEGCGHSSGPSEQLMVRTMLGYATHPSIAYAVLLEHGCEKTHNDYMNKEMKAVVRIFQRIYLLFYFYCLSLASANWNFLSCRNM